MYWASQNPPPAHLFLISGDKDFAGVLHRLRMNNYNVLLASPRSCPAALCSAASIMWEWRSLVHGEDLKGKHFNQPPDGPYGSWYGHDRVALEDPFSFEQPTCVQAEESSKVDSNSKVRPIPDAITKKILKILSANPKGLPMTVLRSELSKKNVIIDKEFYGHKKFSSFLASMNQFLRLRHGDSGRIHVRRVIRRASEPSKCGDIVSGDDNITGDKYIDACSKLSSDDMSVLDTAAGKPTYHPSSEVTQPELQLIPQGEGNYVEVATENPPRQPLYSSPDLLKDVEYASEKLCENPQDSRLESVSASEPSFFRRLMQIFYGCSVDSTDIKMRDVPEQSDNSVSCSHRCPSSMEKSDTSKLTHNLGLCEHVDGGVPESSTGCNSTVKNEKNGHIEQRKLQVTPHSGFSAEVSNNESSNRSRSEILSDCRKLVKRVMKQQPEGYNIGQFNNLFLDTYGYPLDYRKLGHSKLVSLLEVLPSVRVQGNYIFPASIAPAGSRSTSRGEDARYRTERELKRRTIRGTEGY